MGITIEFSSEVKNKLKDKHNVTEDEVCQCFYNREGEFVDDTREEHKTDPLTQWFISKTVTGRELKVIFVFKGNKIHIKSAYDADEKVKKLYKKLQSGN